ncbi:MAG: outer membrane lipoprotein chaperone LolA [Gammaproteobacteria bacterium]|nr:outer membrane lipoprotein chaperone LolA [Gammaproteobacteria bacterium]
MFKRLLCFIILIIPVVSFAITPAARLGELLSGIHSMQADFVQMIASANAVSGQRTVGKMLLLRPGKFRWEIVKPGQQLIIADGKNVWIYDKDLAQVTKKKIDYTQPNNPALLLSGSASDLQKEFNVTSVNHQNGTERFLLKPKSRDAMFQQIELSFLNGKLNELVMVDNLGQKSLIKFANIKINLYLPISVFQFQTPHGVDTVNE